MAEKADFEPIVVAPDQSFAFQESRLPAFYSPWHFHPEVELTFIERGIGRRFVGDNMEEYGPGDLVLLGGDLPHAWFSETPGRSRAYSRCIVVQFDPDFLGSAIWKVPEMESVSQLLLRAGRGLKFEGRVSEKVGERLESMTSESPSERLLSLLGILVVLSSASEVRPLSSSGFVPQLDGHSVDRINSICEYVRGNIGGEITLVAAAKTVGMSPSAFCRYFTKVMGKSFIRFVNEMRIGQVCRDLQETDSSVSEIAYNNGYASLANFNRQFKKIHGMSPKAYRNMHASALLSGR